MQINPRLGNDRQSCLRPTSRDKGIDLLGSGCRRLQSGSIEPEWKYYTTQFS